MLSLPQRNAGEIVINMRSSEGGYDHRYAFVTHLGRNLYPEVANRRYVQLVDEDRFGSWKIDSGHRR